MTGICKICGQSFSSWSEIEPICPNCIRSANLYDMLCYSPDSIHTVSANNNDLSTLTITAQKIVLENGGIQLVIDNDTIKNIGSIEVNGIRFERTKE